MSHTPDIPPTSPEWPAIDRYLADEATPDDLARLDADPQVARSRQALETLRGWFAARRTPSPDRRAAAAHEAWRNIQTAIGVHDAPMRPLAASTSSRRPADVRRRDLRTTRGLWARVALGGAMLAAVAGVFAFVVISRGASHTSMRAARIYTTPAGQRATVTLADGSHITLGPATTVSVFNDEPGAATDVTVSGEALFAVAHRPGRSFAVHAGDAVARVLGTTFLVRRYTTDAATQVVVADGRVAIHRTTRERDDTYAEQTLAAGMRGVVSDSGAVTVVSHIALDDYTSLVSNRLVFRSAPVSAVLAELSRAYGVTIQLADSALATHTLTITVPVTLWSIDDVLTPVLKTLNAHYVRTGHAIVISSGSRAARRPSHSFTSESHYGR